MSDMIYDVPAHFESLNVLNISPLQEYVLLHENYVLLDVQEIKFVRNHHYLPSFHG
jgi:hypothetical protein